MVYWYKVILEDIRKKEVEVVYFQTTLHRIEVRKNFSLFYNL